MLSRNRSNGSPPLYSLPSPGEDLIWTVAFHAAPEAQLEEVLVLITPDGICSLSLGSSILTWASGYFYLKTGAKMVCMGYSLEVPGALGFSASSCSDLGSCL